MQSIVPGCVSEGVAKGEWHLSQWTGSGRPTLNLSGHYLISCKNGQNIKQTEKQEKAKLAYPPSLHLSPMLDVSCPGTLDSKFFSFGTLGPTPVFVRGSRAFSHRLRTALSTFLLLRFWDSDWLPCSSACRWSVVGLHLVIMWVNSPNKLLSLYIYIYTHTFIYI